jgi:hypothetical protein
MRSPTEEHPWKKQLGAQPQDSRATHSAKSSPEHIFNLLPIVSKWELLDEDRTSDREFRQFLYDFSVLGVHLESARAYLASQIGNSSPQYNIVMILAPFHLQTWSNHNLLQFVASREYPYSLIYLGTQNTHNLL